MSFEPSLIQTKKEGRVLLGNWPLTRWIHLSVPQERLVPSSLSNLEETLYTEQIVQGVYQDLSTLRGYRNGWY